MPSTQRAGVLAPLRGAPRCGPCSFFVNESSPPPMRVSPPDSQLRPLLGSFHSSAISPVLESRTRRKCRGFPHSLPDSVPVSMLSMLSLSSSERVWKSICFSSRSSWFTNLSITIPGPTV